MKGKPLDQYQLMDFLCQEWIGVDGVHGFDCYDDDIRCYLLEKNEKVEAKILKQAGEHKIKFKYGPPPKADDLMRGK